MIDWHKTHDTFGYSSLSEAGYRPRVVVICDKCGEEGTKIIRKKSEVDQWECRKCVNKRPDKIEKLRKASKKLWADPQYKKRNLTAVRCSDNRTKLSRNWHKHTKSLMQTSDYKEKQSSQTKTQWEDEDFRKAITESSKSIWEDEDLKEQMLKSRRTLEYRQNQRAKALKRWEDSAYKEKQASAKAKATRTPERLAEIRVMQSKVSKIQFVLYSLLDDLGVKYFKERNDEPDDHECKIGPYSFDCMIPRENKPNLLIEVQGEYWHNQRETRDQQKASYIQNNLSGQYELKCVWEHEFLNRGKVLELLKYWLGIAEIELVSYEFKDVQIKAVNSRDYRLLLSKYHYLTNAGRGGIALGAYFDDMLIAVCVFSPLIRQNIGYPQNETRELSRLCIHPRYQKKNFASWFVSRCIKNLNKEYKYVIAYCDTTFNHDGAVYKACNFRYDKTVKPDYWYIAEDGWAMHKKTLYNQAVKMCMKEKSYAEKHGYQKIFGDKKLRFVFER